MTETAPIYKVIRTRHKRIMLEKVIEKTVCDYARRKGFICSKFVSPSQPGMPDRIFISPQGRVFFMEFKQKGKKPTPLQLRRHLELETNKMTVYTVDETGYGIGLIEGVLYDETHIHPR